jgi:hypothetical protein
MSAVVSTRTFAFGITKLYVIVWLRPMRSSAIRDVTALEALHAAVLVLRQANDFHDSFCLAEMSFGISRMKGLYRTMMVALE